MASARSASLNGGLGAEPPAGSRGRAPCGGSGGEAFCRPTFLYKKWPKVKDFSENLPQCLSRAAMTSPKFWSMGGGRPTGPPIAGSATGSHTWWKFILHVGAGNRKAVKRSRLGVHSVSLRASDYAPTTSVAAPIPSVVLVTIVIVVDKCRPNSGLYTYNKPATGALWAPERKPPLCVHSTHV